MQKIKIAAGVLVGLAAGLSVAVLGKNDVAVPSSVKTEILAIVPDGISARFEGDRIFLSSDDLASYPSIKSVIQGIERSLPSKFRMSIDNACIGAHCENLPVSLEIKFTER